MPSYILRKYLLSRYTIVLFSPFQKISFKYEPSNAFTRYASYVRLVEGVENFIYLSFNEEWCSILVKEQYFIHFTGISCGRRKVKDINECVSTECIHSTRQKNVVVGYSFFFSSLFDRRL